MRPGTFLSIVAVALLGCSAGETEAPSEGPATAPGQATSPAAPIQMSDDRGRPLSLAVPAQRIVSLVPSFTSTLIAVGAIDQLVARTDFDTDPLLADLPSIGGGLGPSREALIVAHPDLVLGFSGNEDPETPAWLSQQGILFGGFRIDALADVPRVTRILGRLSGHAARGEELAAETEDRLAEVERLGSRTSLRAAVVLGGTPPWVAGANSYLGELLTLAGGVNVFSDLDLSHGPVSPEVFLIRDLELLVLMPGAEPPRGSEDVPVLRLPRGIDIPGPELADHAEWLQRELAIRSRGAA